MTDQSLTRFLASERRSGDIDPAETAEWREALLSLVAAHGPARARFILDELAVHGAQPAGRLVARAGDALRQHRSRWSSSRRSRATWRSRSGWLR